MQKIDLINIPKKAVQEFLPSKLPIYFILIPFSMDFMDSVIKNQLFSFRVKTTTKKE